MKKLWEQSETSSAEEENPSYCQKVESFTGIPKKDGKTERGEER